MKKIFLIFFLVLFLAPIFISAADQPYCSSVPDQNKKGIVPCGRDCNDPSTAIDETKACEFCDIFVMGSGLLKWIFEWVVPTVAALMFIIGGVLFLFAGAKADAFNKAKGVITAAVIGLLIIFGAWVIVNTVFSKIGVVELGQGWHWYDIQCKTP